MAIAAGVLAALLFLAAVVLLAPGRVHWGDWQYWYDRYLDSYRWETLSEQVKRRDAYTCRECGHVAARHADYHGGIKWREPMHAHHQRYQKWWWYALRLPEPRRNLVTLCEECHRAEHGKEE